LPVGVFGAINPCNSLIVSRLANHSGPNDLL
jgi:hypothetical protein